MERSISVRTSGGAYPVIIGNGLEYGKLALAVKKPCKAVLVSDSSVFPLYGEAALASLRGSGFQATPYVIPRGEASKTLATVEGLLSFLAAQSMTRSDLLLALGGGVVGDLAGFASAIYLRGVDFIQLPTTLLAAVDSSVGGKTGVDLPAGKNLAGAFHPPLAVFCDTRAFATLPEEIFADGMAEAVKHGMIADREMLRSLGQMPMEELCLRNVAVKARIVEADEFEKGARRLLNFGHTVGHAIENVSGYQIPHGRAVAMGMAVIVRAGVHAGLTSPACIEELYAALALYNLPSYCGYSAKEIAQAALHDKKRSGGTISLVVVKETGFAEIFDLPVEHLEDFIAKGLEA